MHGLWKVPRKDRLHHHLINVHGKGNPERSAAIDFVALSSVSCHHFKQ